MKKKWFAASALAVTVFALPACGNNATNNLGADTPNQHLGRNAQDNTFQNVRNNTNAVSNRDHITRNVNDAQRATRSDVTPVRYGWQSLERMNDSDQAIANRASKIAAGVNNVRKANVIVGGNTIYVTLRVNDNVDDSAVISKVNRAINQKYPNMNVNVVSDLGAFEQMGKVLTGGNNMPNTNSKAPINTVR